jgi:hypothetical protein
MVKNRGSYAKLSKDDDDTENDTITDDNNNNIANNQKKKQNNKVGSSVYTILTDEEDDNDDNDNDDNAVRNPIIIETKNDSDIDTPTDTADSTTVGDDSEIEDFTPTNPSSLSEYMEKCKSNLKVMLTRVNDDVEVATSTELLDSNGIHEQDKVTSIIEEESSRIETQVESISIVVNDNDNVKEEEDEACEKILCCNLKYWCKTNEDSVLVHRNVLLVTSLYGLIAMAYIILEETIPLFLKLSEEQGGLAFDSFSIGLLLSLTSILLLFFTSFFLPKIASKSKLWMFRMGIYGGAPFTIMWPLVAYLYNHYIQNVVSKKVAQNILWILLVGVCTFKSIFACLSFTAVMILINNSVYNQYLGTNTITITITISITISITITVTITITIKGQVNGFAQMLASLARCIGPALGGLFWSIACKFNIIALNFLTVSVLLVVSLALINFIPPSLDFTKKASCNRSS